MIRNDETLTPYQKVLYWFFDYPYLPVSLSELSGKLHISKSTAYRIVSDLVDEGFLVMERVGRTWRITCNISHPYNTTRKVPYHLQLILESSIIDRISDRFPGCTAIVLFGSYRKGDDIQSSDLDFAVEVPEYRGVKSLNFTRIDLGFRKSVPVNLLVFSRDKIDLNLFANIANGIVLRGFLEVKP